MRPTIATAFTSCLIAILLQVPARGEELADGVYKLVLQGKGTRVSRSSGGTVEVGERLTSNFGEATIWSLSNTNDRFRVLLKKAGPFDPRGRFVLHIDGVSEVASSNTDPDEEGNVELIFDIGGEANARKVAAALETGPRTRKHPGHQMLVTWRPIEESYRVGEPVLLELAIHNVGDVTIRFVEGGQQRGPRDNQFGFTAFAGSGFGEPVPDTGDPTNFGGIGAFRELKPGETFRKRVDISKWFKFEEPNSYQITGMYELDLHDKQFSSQLLWQDFATGRCLVRITE